MVVPNKTLEPGKYLFRLEGRDRHIVQIYTGDRAKLIHTATAVGSMRADQPERPEIRLIESSANAPVAIGSWWYPEMRQGWEFVYPRQQAATLAKTAQQPILTTKANVPASDVEAGKVESGGLVRLNPGGGESAYVESSEAQPASLKGTAQVGEVADANSNAPSNTVASASTRQRAAAGSANAQQASNRAELPKTASHQPFVALIALMALAAAFGLRLWRTAR